MLQDALRMITCQGMIKHKKMKRLIQRERLIEQEMIEIEYKEPRLLFSHDPSAILSIGKKSISWRIFPQVNVLM